jgi:hypothetical protein
VPPSPPKNYTITEVSDILRITPYYARELCKGKKIPGAHKPAGMWLIDRTAFDAWIDQSKSESKAVAS